MVVILLSCGLPGEFCNRVRNWKRLSGYAAFYIQTHVAYSAVPCTFPLKEVNIVVVPLAFQRHREGWGRGPVEGAGC